MFPLDIHRMHVGWLVNVLLGFFMSTIAAQLQGAPANRIELTAPPNCSPISNGSFAGGFLCNATDIGFGFYDSQLNICTEVRFTCYSPGGGVSCYLFPNSSQAAMWGSYSYLTPNQARAVALGGCTQTAFCTIPYTVSNKTDAAYLQSKLQGSKTNNNNISIAAECLGGSLPPSTTRTAIPGNPSTPPAGTLFPANSPAPSPGKQSNESGSTGGGPILVPTKEGTSSISTGTIVGVAIGCGVGAALLAAGITLLILKERTMRLVRAKVDDLPEAVKTPPETFVKPDTRFPTPGFGVPSICCRPEAKYVPMTPDSGPILTSISAPTTPLIKVLTSNDTISILLDDSAECAPNLADMSASSFISPEVISVYLDRNGQPMLLGRGGCGAVFLGLIRRSQRAAIKTIHGGGAKQRALLVREIYNLHRCRHPNIIQFYGYSLQDSRLLLLMEYAAGGSLYNVLKYQQETQSWQAWGGMVARDIAAGLIHLHYHEIAHLDIKSSNILFVNRVAKIADVGLGKMIQGGRNPRATQLGTFCFASPEQLTGSPCGLSSDMWSFGSLLWEICMGQPLESRHHGLIPSGRVPASIIGLIDHCHTEEPKARPTAQQAHDIIVASLEAWH